MSRFATLLALLLLASGASGQTPGSCNLGQAEADLSGSNVFARVFNTGSLFFGNTTTNGDGYLVPKSSGNSPLFAAGLWVAGRVGGKIRSAGSRYTGFTFWPGPLDDGATLPSPSDCSDFDRIYRVNASEIADYERGLGATSDLADWPVGLGAPSVDASGQPLAVTSREQTLDLASGERPYLRGNEMAFWVMNDVGRDHGNGPLGIEVRVTASSIWGNAITGASEATIYRYEIVNRGTNTIGDMRAGIFIDPDLGDSTDDFVGTDRERGMVFAYNSGEVDNTYGTPPALGFDVLSGLSSSMLFASAAGGPTITPSTPEGVYSFLSGLWGDGSLMRESSSGYQQPNTFPVTTTVYPGDPVTRTYWSEEDIDGSGTRNAPGDRRGVFGGPALTLASGESYTFDLAILFAWGNDRLDSITMLRAVSDAFQASYDANVLYVPNPESAVAAETAPEASGVALTIAPNPARGAATVRLALAEASGVRVRVVDALGREVATLADGSLASGEHVWALPERLPTGVYLVQAITDDYRSTARWTVVR